MKNLKKYYLLVIFLFSVFLIYSCNQNIIQNQTNTWVTNTGDVIDISENPNIGTLKDESFWFELSYPINYFWTWSEPKILTWSCNSSWFPIDCPNIENIVPDIKNYLNYSSNEKNESINWVSYCFYKLQDAWAGHIYNNYYYSTVKNNNCIVVNFQTSLTNCDFYLPLEDWNTQQKTNYDNCLSKARQEPNIVNDISSSFKFSK